MTSSAHDPVVFEARFAASLQTGTPIKVDPQGGIVLLAAGRIDDPEQVPVALVVDLAGLGGRNDGASATNAMEAIVGHWRGSVASTFACPQGRPVWVQVDSLARFDLVIPSVIRGGAVHIGWRPLPSVSGRSQPSTRAAFAELFPGVAPHLLHRLDAITATVAAYGWPSDR